MVYFTRIMMNLHRKNLANRNDIRFWRRRQVLKMTQHFYGRTRNCFSLAIRRLQKSLKYVTVGRRLRQTFMRHLWQQRIDAACKELRNMPEGSRTMLEAFARQNVSLNRQSISGLAIWEPRTFECLNKIAAVKANEEKIGWKLGPFPKGVLGKL